jgi:hypothetical protein
MRALATSEDYGESEVARLWCLIVWARPPEHQDTTHLLHDRGIRPITERLREFVPGVPVCAGEPDFDQLVCGERAIDFRDHRVRCACLPDLHDRLEGVGSGFESCALAWSQSYWHQ